MTTEHTGRNRKASPDQLRLDTIIYGSVCTLRESQAMAEELLHLRKRTATLESQIDELEMANSRLEGDSIDLHEKIDEWKAAAGLNDSSGDPGGIEPRHLIAERNKQEAGILALISELATRTEELYAERKVHASTSRGMEVTALALDAAAAKVAVIERLDKWLNDDSQTLHAEITYEYASLHDEKRVLAIGLIPGIFDAIDAALREVVS